MSRIINTEGAAKDRTRLMKSIVLALRELMRQTSPDQTSRDLAAFMALALEEIHVTIDSSASAWEKRGYWLKADRFRMEWDWTGSLGSKIRQAVLTDDWPAVALAASKVAQKLMKTDVPLRHRLGTPWVGAWDSLRKRG